jgi:polygalacturonase
VTGKNVYMHDLRIWNDDDCIAVKDGSENMLFERIEASGLGLVIGSIGGSRVNNITFRDAVMHRTFKGIYMKTRWSDSGPVGESASISNILYQNITMDAPQQWAIWIGPAQQSGQPCPLYWPGVPNSECRMSGYQTWSNITLKDITINDPVRSPGVLISNSSNPITGLVFDNVVVNGAPVDGQWGSDFYYCNTTGTAVGTTTPVPPCFTKGR